MPTLILTPRFTEDSQGLREAALRSGWRVERLPSWRVPKEFISLHEPVLYVEAMFGPLIAKELGVTLLDPPLDWLPQLPVEYRQREIRLTTLGEARQALTDGPAFIKPPNDKSFQAQVYSAETLPSDFPDLSPVLLSEIVSWQVEFRCFLLDRQLKSLSVYLRDGLMQAPLDFPHSPDEEREIRDFINQLAHDERVPLPRAIVLDVGRITDKGWAVIEANAAWGAGLYGCDPVETLSVIHHASIKSAPK